MGDAVDDGDSRMMSGEALYPDRGSSLHTQKESKGPSRSMSQDASGEWANVAGLASHAPRLATWIMDSSFKVQGCREESRVEPRVEPERQSKAKSLARD